MKSSEPTELGRALVKFFHEYLPKQKGGSAHTVRSYRDALRLLLPFTAREAHRPSADARAALEQFKGQQRPSRRARIGLHEVLAISIRAIHIPAIRKQNVRNGT